MVKKVSVSSAQVAAARLKVERAAKSGSYVDKAVKAIANPNKRTTSSSGAISRAGQTRLAPARPVPPKGSESR